MMSPESQVQFTQSRIMYSMSDQPGWGTRYHSAPWFRIARTDRMSPMAPSRTRFQTSTRAASRRSCVPVMTLNPRPAARSAVCITALTPGTSTATGFSMKRCLRASTTAAMCIGRKCGGVACSTRSTPESSSF